MRLKPNDSPAMELDEKRNFQFKLSGAVGANSISSVTVSTDDTLTIGTPSTSGTTVTVAVTATQTGTQMLKVSATLSSGEIVNGFVRVKVIDSSKLSGRSTDYGD